MNVRLATNCIVASMLVCLPILTGCQADGNLYPVQGQLAQLNPQPVFSAGITGSMKMETFHAKIAGGETVSCSLTAIANGKKRVSDPPASDTQSPFNMPSAWDAVYGASFYEAHVLGTHGPYYWRGATGSPGTALHAEIYVTDYAQRKEYGQKWDNVFAPRAEDVKGVVQDDKRNIYKFAL